MDWQQVISLSIVGIAAAMLLRARLRQKFSFQKDTHCGCLAVAQSAPRNSIVYRARKGQRPEVIVKMR